MKDKNRQDRIDALIRLLKNRAINIYGLCINSKLKHSTYINRIMKGEKTLSKNVSDKLIKGLEELVKEIKLFIKAIK